MEKRERISKEPTRLDLIPSHEDKLIYDLSKEIEDCYDRSSASTAPDYLRNYQNIQIANAINALASGHYFLCKECLSLAFAEEVSKEKWHINKLKREAVKLDLKAMIENLPNLIH